MPGSIIVRPIEANLTHNANLITKMNPYCSFIVGNSRVRSQICKRGGKHPHWNDSVTLPITNEQKILVELMDKDKLSHDDNIGSFMLDLNEIQSSGQVSKWYPLSYKNRSAGEILLEAVFQPSGGMTAQDQYQQGQQAYTGSVATGTTGNQYYEEEHLRGTQPGLIQKEEEIITKTTTTEPTAVIQEETLAKDTSKHSNVWTEQRQVVEPHTFVKEVEVVETRPALKEIEVMEPVKVVKDVEYTQAVPVKKQVEVVEPQVVRKEVEVIEPQLVTKTIQVVENVPVKKQVEVVEMRNAIQEVETVEPQTFHKQVEVTEFQPMRKQVEVTQPVTLKKAVEFVEPVITTQTVTKELQQPVIINQEITTEVGPASVVGMSAEYGYYQSYGQISLAEQQRLSGLQRWVGYETIFGGLNDQERLWEQHRLSRLNDQEWSTERQRLMGMNEKDRLTHQRGFFAKLKQALGLGQNQYSNQYSSGQHATGFKNQHRWHGHDNLFTGLNEKERLFEQERINRFSDNEWNTERQRLFAFNDQDRLAEQRRLYKEYQQNGGFSHFKKTTETIEKTTNMQGGANFDQNFAHSSKYNPSPNF